MINIFVYTDNEKIISSLRRLKTYLDEFNYEIKNFNDIERPTPNDKVIIFHKEKESLQIYKLLRLPYLVEPVRLSYLNEASNQKNSLPVIYIAYQDLSGLITEDLNYSLLACDNACKFINWFDDKENKVKELINSFSVSSLDNAGKIKLKKLWHEIAQYNLQKFQDESNPNEKGHHAAKNILGPIQLLMTAGETEAINILKAKWDVNGKKILVYEYLLTEVDKSTPITSNADELKTFLKERQANIYLIDDDAEDCGWNEALKYLFFENPDNLEPTGNDEKTYKVGDVKFTYRTFIDANNKSDLEKIITDYDCLLLDLYFTDKDEKEPYGLTILNEIRKLNKGFPVIVFTSSGKAENLDKSVNEGITGYFIKNVDDYENFKKLIKKAINYSWLTQLWSLYDSLKNNSNYLEQAIEYTLLLSFKDIPIKTDRYFELSIINLDNYFKKPQKTPQIIKKARNLIGHEDSSKISLYDLIICWSIFFIELLANKKSDINNFTDEYNNSFYNMLSHGKGEYAKSLNDYIKNNNNLPDKLKQLIIYRLNNWAQINSTTKGMGNIYEKNIFSLSKQVFVSIFKKSF